MLLLMSSQYMSPVHPALHPPGDEVEVIVEPPVEVVEPEMVVV